MGKEEAARIMARHKEDMGRLEDTLANEQGRQMDAMRERIQRRKEKNREAASLRAQRQIKMAAVAKRKAEQRAVALEVGGLEDADEGTGKAALEKCVSKVGHMQQVLFKGGFSAYPDQKRKVVERTLHLMKRLKGEDPLAAILAEAEAMTARKAEEAPMQSVRAASLHDSFDNDTILLSEAGPAPERLTYKEL